MRSRVVLMTLAAGVLLQTEAHALYRDQFDKAMWPRRSLITVCWKPGINPEGGLQKRIRAAVEDTWGRYSSIGFQGWGTCPASTPAQMVGQHAIFIEPSSGATSSYVGRQFTPFDGKPVPTLMSINFNAPVRSLCDLGPGGNSNDECVTWSAVHEFGHALGFKHEHARPDFQECAKSRADIGNWFFRDKRQGGGVSLTTYDDASVMNYCSSNGNADGRLSWKDVAGLQEVYGLKPRGSMVGPGGRCVDVDNSNLGDGSAVQLWDCWDGPNQRWAWSYWDGLFQTHANWACLDDASGGTSPGTGVDVWNCDNRANARWNFNQFYLQGMGNKCLDLEQGNAIFAGCRFGAQFQWTFTPNGQLQRFGSDRCLTFGAQGTQPTMTVCDPGRLDQQLDLTASGFLISRQRELCLEVPDSFPYTMSKLPIRMAQCNSGKLTQQFYFSGFMRTNAGLCMSHAPTDISRNGVRLTVEQCSTRLTFWDFYMY